MTPPTPKEILCRECGEPIYDLTDAERADPLHHYHGNEDNSCLIEVRKMLHKARAERDASYDRNSEVVRCWLCPGLDAGEALATVQPMHDSRAVVIMDAAAFDAMKNERDAAVQKARYESDVAAQAMAAKDAAERELAQEKEGSAEWEEESAAWSRKCRDVQEECDELRAKLADAERERDRKEIWLGERVDKIVTIAAHEAALCDLRARLAEAEKDKERLDWMADDPPFDGLGDHDLYECWHMVAHENGREEATQDDKRKAFRRLLDHARTAATAQGE
jgi:hypothetical protein